jgi:lipopolysaccharide transport protein LptA
VKNPNKVNRTARIAAMAIVAIALASPAWAQDGVNTPMSSPASVPAMGEGTVGNSIRPDRGDDAPAPIAQPAPGDDMSGDSISVTGGVPGSTTSAALSGAAASDAQPATTAGAPAMPLESAPSQPPVASAPAAPVVPPESAPAEASAPAAAGAPPESAVSQPPVASAPASAPAVSATTPEAPVTASEPAPAAVPSTPPAPEAAVSVSTPVTTAAMPPSGAIAPPMVLAPVPSEIVAPEAEPAPASAPVAAEQAPPPRQSDKSAGKTGKGEAKDTKVASNAPQESSPLGLQFGNSKGPIDIKSESMSLDYQNHSVLWTGHVHANQANAQLTSDNLRVNYFDKDFKDLKDMVADGNVRISQGTRWATGQHGVMDQTKRTMVLTGSPVVHDCANQITGKRITVFLDTSKSVVEGAHAVIFPHQAQGADDAAPTTGCQ